MWVSQPLLPSHRRVKVDRRISRPSFVVRKIDVAPSDRGDRQWQPSGVFRGSLLDACWNGTPYKVQVTSYCVRTR